MFITIRIRLAVLAVVASLGFTTLVAPGGLLAQETTPPSPPARLLRLTLRGQVFEGAPPMGIFGNVSGSSLRSIVDALRGAADDPSVAGLILRLRGTSMSWTQMQTLRRELIRFRRSGKPSHCFIDSAGTRTFLLASACSEVTLHPTGIIEIPGVQGQRVFFKELLDKVGIVFEELRVGRYKSAAEGFTRKESSDPVREEMQAILDEVYADLIESLAQNRELEPLEARALIDRRLFGAEEAREAGLVDHVEYSSEYEERVCKVGDRRLEIQEARLAPSMDLDFSGLAGMIKLFNELMGGGRGRSATSGTPRLALVVAEGPIMDSASSVDLFGSAAITPREFVRIFRRVREDDSVKAVVFRVNSPGGSALASDLILREVELTAKEKPVVVSMADTAASGGYYISCGATWIFAERATLTGSIGVIGAIPSVRPVMETIGVRLETYSRGKRADIVSAYGDLTDEGREMFLEYMRRVYDQFIDHVATGRGLGRDAVASIAEGRVWTGARAREIGLVDAVGGVEDAMAHARDLAGLPEESEILTLPRPKTFLDILQGEVRAAPVALREVLGLVPEDFRAALRQVEWLLTLRGPRALTWMPEAILVR